MTEAMLETALVAFATFFATIGPLDVAIVFATLTAEDRGRARRAVALRGVLIAGAILLAFALFGEAALGLFGVTMPALRIAGGVLLMLIAIDLVFARPSGAASTTAEENAEAATRADISVFPLATPLIAGPGAIGAVVLLMGDAGGDPAASAMVIAALGAILALTFALMLIAGGVQRVLGKTGVHVVARVFGVILAALAVQFVLDGLAQSGLFPGAAAR